MGCAAGVGCVGKRGGARVGYLQMRCVCGRRQYPRPLASTGPLGVIGAAAGALVCLAGMAVTGAGAVGVAGSG
eukprot:1155616-Pelagomonas_calceolata.AAC.19